MAANLLQRKAGIRSRLLLAFLALVLVLVTLSTTVALINQTIIERRNALEQLNIVADVQAANLEQWEAQNRATIRQVETAPLLRTTLFQLMGRQGEQPVQDTFDEQQEEFAAFANRLIVDSGGRFDRLLLVNADGYVVGTDQIELLGADVRAEPWFQPSVTPPADDTIDLYGPLADPFVDDGGQQRQSFYFVLPVWDSTGVPLGVLVGRSRTATLTEVVVNLPGLGETGEVLLVGPNRSYITPPRHNPDLRVAEGAIVDDLLTEQTTPNQWQDYRGEPVLGVTRTIDSLSLGMVVKQDISEVRAGQSALALNIVIGVVTAIAAAGAGVYLAQQLTRPVEALTETATRILRGNLDASAPPSRISEFDQLAAAFNQMTDRVQDLVQRQEAIITDRTRQLEITAQMGRVIAAETDLERLLNLTVNMVRDRLGYYHAQVFMIDDLRQYAVLRASTGKAGEALIARGHKLAVGSRSVIGQVTDRGEPILAGDTTASMVHRPNELLPETRAELAVPLRIGDQVIGALDIQSVNPKAFDEGTVSVLQTVADQLAVAIRNAQLFQEREGLLSTSLQLTQILTRDNWAGYSEERQLNAPVGFSYDLSQVLPLDPSENGGENGGFRLPIELRGEEIGMLTAALDAEASLPDEDRELIASVLDRMALALDNARLFEQTQSSLSETARLYQASQNIADSNSVNELTKNLLTMSSAVEAVDRAAFYVLDDPDEEPGGRVVMRVGEFDRDHGIDLPQQPARLLTGQPPLTFIEETALDGLIIDDVHELPPERRAGLAEVGVLSTAVFPLVSGGRVLAWLQLESSSRTRAFTEADVRFFETVADQAGTSLESARLLEQTQMRARRLQAVNEVTRASSSILNKDILLPLVVQQISEAFDYYHVQIFVVDEIGEWANLAASTGDVGQQMLRKGHRLAVGSQSVIGRVTEIGEPVIAKDTGTDTTHRPNPLLPDTRAEMAIPLKTGDRVIGALDVQSTVPNAFDEEALLILQSLADQVSVALENAQLFQEIQDRVAELTTINLVSQAVSRAETMDDLFDVVALQLMRTFGAQYGFLALVHNGMIDMPIFIDSGRRIDSPAPYPVGQGLTSIVIQSAKPLVITNNAEERAHELGASVVGGLPGSLLIVPLTIGEEVIGAVSMQADEEGAYDDSHVRQLTTLAAYIAVKIRNAELLANAQRSARELGFLFNMTRAAVSTTDLDEALNNVVRIIQFEMDNAETATVYIQSEDAHIFRPVASIGYESNMAAPISTEADLPAQVAVQNVPLVIDDAQVDGASLHPNTHGMLIVPLNAGQETLGVITVGSQERHAFRENDLNLLGTASSTLTAVIQNALLIERIERANEELKEFDQLKSQFLANMSHELRTPLNSIIGFSKVILNGIDGPLTDLQRQDLTTIHDSGKHLLGLINDILDMSKIESGKMEVHPEYLNISDTVNGVMSTSIALVKDKPIELRKEVENQLPDVYADPKRVRQILLNLMSNAAKFTHEGSITLRARLIQYDPEHDLTYPHVRFDVEDTGIGIDEEGKQLLFERFRQVDGSTTRQVGGTGLGLPITKEFIELMGGAIWVESAVGEGSTFSFGLPIEPVTGDEESPQPTPEVVDDRPIIVAVDDEPRVLDLYRRYLEREGFNMVGIGHAEGLNDTLADLHPVAVLLDLNLPKIDGLTALENIKTDPKVAHIPVIICSIHEERTRGLELGAADYITKPIIEEQLLGSLSHILDVELGNNYDMPGEQPTPLEEAPSEPEEAPYFSAPQAPRGGRPDRTLQILIVDSEEDYADAVAALLEEFGDYEARVVYKGFEGIGYAVKQRPDVMILDLNIQDMDGYGMIAAMRTNDETMNVPVIILTERELSDEELANLDDGLTLYLNKADYDAESLLEALETGIDLIFSNGQ